MGRSPCCDKLGLKKGPWSPEEDQKLLAYIEENGHVSWRALPAKAGLQRCGKSCRLRWTNYLRPDIKRGKFTLQEEQTIIQLHALLGNRWSAIACHLPKRTDNEIKNYWNTHLRKRLDKMGIDPATHRPKSAALGPAHGHQTKGSANLSHMAQWESARLEAEARLLRDSKLRSAAIQSQLSPAATSTGEWKPAAPPLCLDVLKAWQEAWSGNSSPAGCATSGIDLESPTSTLNFSEDAARPPAQTNSSSIMVSFTDKCNKEEEDQLDWKVSCQEVDGEWSDQGYSSKIEPQRGSMFMEGFSDLLLENSYYQTSSNSKGEATNVAGHGEEDGKDYWKNILNLVNSSPSDSPMF